MNDNFHTFAVAVNKRLNELSKHELYVVDGIDLFTTYLLSFPEGTNPQFRTNTEHDCSCCKNFVRNMGGLVAIVNGRKQSIWQVDNMPAPYDIVAESLNTLVQQLPIKSVFRTKEHKFGTERNYDADGRKWNHFWGEVAKRHRHTDPAEARGFINTSAQVLRRGLDELDSTALSTVMDLIDSRALYRGEEFRKSVQEFITLQRAYRNASNPELCVWDSTASSAARFRNTVIGTLVQDLSDGVDLEKAVRSFEQKVAPTNYKRTTALITPVMVTKAVEKLRELGLEQCIDRRFAVIGDISVNDVLFVDNSVQAQMKDALTSMLMDAAQPTVNKAITNVQGIGIEEFVRRVVPQARKIEVLVRNKHQGNFVSLTAPKNSNSGRLFRWNNDFAWSYDGEVTDSIKQRVKRAGGNTNAALRVSLAWSNYDDLDIHAYCPDGHIYFGNKQGILDVDMNAGGGRSREPVENLSWIRPRNGDYCIEVNQYSRRETANVGFTLEVECQGRVQQFSYAPGVTGTIKCISFAIKNGEMMDLKVLHRDLKGGDLPQTKWGITTEAFVPVATMMTSPNHWEGAGEVGSKHWMFILEGCVNPEPVRGIYNEFLRGDLEPHRKVFEVLGSKTKCEPTANQLSGLGFTAARNDEVTVRVTTDSNTRAYSIVF